MIKSDCTDELCFHDCSLVKILSFENETKLFIEDIYAGDIKYSTNIMLKNVDEITRNGVSIDKLQMETDDGEVYSFEEQGSDIILDIIWHKYSPRSEDFCTYLIKGKNMTAKVYNTIRSE